jgi:hypothetical protein
MNDSDQHSSLLELITGVKRFMMKVTEKDETMMVNLAILIFSLVTEKLKFGKIKMVGNLKSRT